MTDHISSDLKCWEYSSESKEHALKFMKDKNFDLLGIRKNEVVLNRILTNKGKIEIINQNEIIPDGLPITELLEKFIQEKKKHYFLTTNGDIKKIVTIGDLQKGPARLLLFGLIMNFEIISIDLIMKYVPDWQDLLKKGIIKKIKKRYNRLKTQDLDIDMLHCSYIDDKIKIIKKSEKFKIICLECEKDEGEVRFYLRQLTRLRNNLAHSNHMRTNFKKWDDLLETIRICRIFTSEMRRFL